MNYRHSYHAGSFADVFKHTVLVMLIQALLVKNKPFCYFDTHAGTARYDLDSEPAQKSREFETGIARVWSASQPPLEAATYLEVVKSFNHSPSFPHFYPGSPSFVRHLLRPDDCMILCELHPEDAQQLKQEFRHDKQVAVHQRDGYEALKALLPPKERRGLVLIDPPYEHKNEVHHICTAINAALQRWETGIYAIWYPLKDETLTKQLHQAIKSLTEKILITELSIYPEDLSLSLFGSGMIIINPPWQFEQQLQKLLPWLWQTLSPLKQGSYRVITQ